MMEQMTPQDQQGDPQNIRKQMIISGRIRNYKQQLMNLAITCENIEINKVGKKIKSICEQWQCNGETPND